MSTTPTAADLISQADAATTNEQLDEIEAQANGRTTVIDAVSKRRSELLTEQSQQEDVAADQSQTVGGVERADEPSSMPPANRSAEEPPTAEEMPDYMPEFHAEQTDPPPGPYPDPPIGPYPDPVEKEPQVEDYDPDKHRS
jgi:hypothetical protein